MDDARRARKALLLQRNNRRLRMPAIRSAWRSFGITTSALDDERCEQLIAWLRAYWRKPRQPETQLQQRIKAFSRGRDTVVVLDFWQWDEAVALIVSSAALGRVAARMSTIYPSGFLVVDQPVTRGLLVDFDDQDGTQIAELEV